LRWWVGREGVEEVRERVEDSKELKRKTVRSWKERKEKGREGNAKAHQSSWSSSPLSSSSSETGTSPYRSRISDSPSTHQAKKKSRVSFPSSKDAFDAKENE